MKKKLTAILTIMVCVFILTACECKHQWTDATCTEPQYCTKCNTTNGTALGHSWKEATCTEPKTCTVCGETEGEALGHTWTEATCTEPKTCTVCGETEGEPLGHEMDEAYQVVDCDYVNETATRVYSCKLCGEEMKREEAVLDSLYNGTTFVITPSEFCERIDAAISSDSGSYYSAMGSAMERSSGNTYVCYIYKGNDAVGIVEFSLNGITINPDQSDASGVFNSISCFGADTTEMASNIRAVAIAIDPSFDLSTDIYTLAEGLEDDLEVTIHGIHYQLSGSFFYIFTAEIAD